MTEETEQRLQEIEARQEKTVYAFTAALPGSWLEQHDDIDFLLREVRERGKQRFPTSHHQSVVIDAVLELQKLTDERDSLRQQLNDCTASHQKANAEIASWENLFDVFPDADEIQDVLVAVTKLVAERASLRQCVEQLEKVVRTTVKHCSGVTKPGYFAVDPVTWVSAIQDHLESTLAALDAKEPAK